MSRRPLWSLLGFHVDATALRPFGWIGRGPLDPRCRPGGTVRLEVLGSETDVELQVRDHGTGITPDLLPRVFEPHFSTRSGGTGLGLAIVRRLVKSWGGTVRAESRPGRGTVIWMHLAPWVGPRANDSGMGADGGSVPRADS